MLAHLAALTLLPILVDGAPLLAPPDAPCTAGPCAARPPPEPGGWSFVVNGARWRVAVDADGRVHAVATRAVRIGADLATYRSTLAGTVAADRVTLTVTADEFSLPNFVPGPPTICVGLPAGEGRFEGRCANAGQRTPFTFSRD